MKQPMANHGDDYVTIGYRYDERNSTPAAKEQEGRIQASLDKLGPTHLDVISNLIRLEIRGYTNSSRSCPIANYLRREGFTDITVGRTMAWDYILDAGQFEKLVFVQLPWQINQFIIWFDDVAPYRSDDSYTSLRK